MEIPKRTGLALTAILLFLRVPFASLADDRPELTVWVLGMRPGWKAAMKRFEGESGLKVVASVYGTNMDPQKLMCGIAGGSPPDVIYQDRFAVGGWAARDAFLPLDPYLAKSSVIRKEDFYPAAWDEACYKGKVYAIPIGTDDRALYYNRDHLKAAGLVDEHGEAKPPQTWDQLKADALKLSQHDPDKSIRRLGFIPNFGNSWLYFYGWQNGGAFMSEDRTKVTLNEPRIAEALQFMVDTYDALGGVEQVDKFSSGFEAGEHDPFGIGKISMVITGSWHLDNLATYFTNMNFGVAPAPVPKGKPFITWCGGFAWAIPSGAKHPDEAWRFIEFVSRPDIGMMMYDVERRYSESRGAPYVPFLNANRVLTEQAYRKLILENEDLPPTIKSGYKQFMELLPVARFRPVTAVGQELWDQHARAFELAVHQVYPPQEALDRCTAEVQKELDRLQDKQPAPPLHWTLPAVLFALLLLVPGLVFVVRAQRVARQSLFRGEGLAGLLFISPWLFGFLLLTVGPIFVSIVFSLCDYDVLHAPRYVGLANYIGMLKVHVARDGSWLPWQWSLKATQPLFWRSLWNTLYMMVGVPLGMAVGLGVAMLLNTKVKGMTVYRTIYYLPAIVPAVASSILWLWVLNPTNGLINVILKPLGLGQPPWLTDPAWAKPSIILMGLWGAGSGMIIWLAGLQGIPQHLYEAATIDGAGWWSRFLHVTLPMLSPYIFFNLIMGIIGTLQIFTQAYIITQGGPVDSTLFYVYNLFNYAFKYFRMGEASAMAWILFLVILALTLFQLKLAPRWVHYEVE